MAKALAAEGKKWPEQIPNHIKKYLEELGQDYSLSDVINVCEEIIELFNKGEGVDMYWQGYPVPDLMMSTVTFRNKYKRYIH